MEEARAEAVQEAVGFLSEPCFCGQLQADQVTGADAGHESRVGRGVAGAAEVGVLVVSAAVEDDCAAGSPYDEAPGLGLEDVVGALHVDAAEIMALEFDDLRARPALVDGVDDALGDAGLAEAELGLEADAEGAEAAELVRGQGEAGEGGEGLLGLLGLLGLFVLFVLDLRRREDGGGEAEGREAVGSGDEDAAGIIAMSSIVIGIGEAAEAAELVGDPLDGGQGRGIVGIGIGIRGGGGGGGGSSDEEPH